MITSEEGRERSLVIQTTCEQCIDNVSSRKLDKLQTILPSLAGCLWGVKTTVLSRMGVEVSEFSSTARANEFLAREDAARDRARDLVRLPCLDLPRRRVWLIDRDLDEGLDRFRSVALFKTTRDLCGCSDVVGFWVSAIRSSISLRTCSTCSMI